MNNKRYNQIIKKYKIDNNLLTLENYLTVESKLENENTQKKWLDEIIQDLEEKTQEEIKVLLVNNIIVDKNIKNLEDLIEMFKDYLSDNETKNLIEYGYKEIDEERLVNDEINHSDRYLEIDNDCYYKDIDDLMYDFKNNHKEHIEIDEDEDYESRYETELEVLNENNEYFSNLEKEEKFKALIFLEDFKMNREQIYAYYEEVIGFDYEGFESYLEWNEKKIKSEVLYGFDNGDSNEYIELNTDDNNKYIRVMDIAWNDNHKALIEATNELKDENLIYDLNIRIIKKEPYLLNKSIFSDDIEFQKTLVKLNGEVLEYVSDELKGDMEIVLIAVTENTKNIKYASEEIQDLCRNKNPISVLNSTIMKKDFEKDVVNKKGKNKIKI